MNIENHDELITYLRENGHIGPDESPRVHTLEGGVSNRTVHVERPLTGEAWVLKQALEQLRVEEDWFSRPERIQREAEGLRWLLQLTPENAVPAFIFEDRDHDLLAMEAIPEPHENWKRMLLDGRLETRHVEAFGALLADVHTNAYRRREEVSQAFENRSFFEALRLDPYYRFTAEQVPEASSFLEQLIETVKTRRITLVHGDYSPKNILIHDDHPVLLDHEVIHFGDPAFDIGFSMTHLLSKAHHMPAHRDAFVDGARTYWKTYRSRTEEEPWASDLESHAVEHLMGCLLARVAGKSLLEYMSEEEREQQVRAVCALLPDPPDRIPNLIERFIESCQKFER